MGTKRKRKLKGIPKTVMKQENTLLYNENVNEKKINGRHFKRKLSVISEVPHEDDSKRCKYEVTREVFDKEKLKRLLNNVVHWRQNCEGFQDVSSKEEKREKKSDIVNKEKLKLLLNKVSEMKETELRMQKDDEINIIGVKFNGLFNPNISYNSEVMPLNSVRSNIVRHPEGGSFSQLRAERPFVTASDAGVHKLNDGGDPNAHIFDTHKLKTLLSKVMHREESQCLTNKQCDSPSSSGRDLKISKNICSTFKKRGSSSFTVQNKPVVKSIEFNSLTLKDVMIQRLHAARFRYINERFYKTTSEEAQKFFEDDPEAFAIYHEGYQAQVNKWPVSPLDIIINDLKKRSRKLVVADLGCGEAKLARSVHHTVHSFDLVAVNEKVTACNVTKVPLKNNSVDVAVFCLSLMGTDLTKCLMEANRILKIGGLLKIAEVESRFEDLEVFIKSLQKLGFQLTKKDLRNRMFLLMDFTKTRQSKNKNQVTIHLKPCIYKKR